MDYLKLCRVAQVNPEYPLIPLEGLRLEFQKGIDGGWVSLAYLHEKHQALGRWLNMMEREAKRQETNLRKETP